MSHFYYIGDSHLKIVKTGKPIPIVSVWVWPIRASRVVPYDKIQVRTSERDEIQRSVIFCINIFILSPLSRIIREHFISQNF